MSAFSQMTHRVLRLLYGDGEGRTRPSGGEGGNHALVPQGSLDPLPELLGVRVLRHSWPVRVLASALTALLFLTSSPPLLAITMGQIKAGSTSGAGGGQGSAPNLVNAGAASAALTAALTKKSQQQAADVVAAMQKLQAQAAKSAKANPATVLPNGQTVNGDTAVYNGLKAGWLEPYVKGGGAGIVNGTPVTTSWSGASITPSQNAANAANPNYVNIQQSSQNAYLYWNKFNVGPKTTVNFDQSKGGATVGNWIAFNKVMSATDPSHIFGNITAQGQVWILNQNGLLFHNGSTVNTHTLVASTLPINRNLAGDALDGVTGRGIANNPDNQFLFSGLKLPSGKNGPTPSFDPSLGSVPQSTTPGDVVVESGASIVSPPNSAGVGGLVALVGPNVRNDGTISTVGGQSVLAAGLQVALNPHASKDPTLRGMDVVIGAVRDARLDDEDPLVQAGAVVPLAGDAGNAVNNGLISFDRGNATMAGKSVIQGSLPDDSLTPVNGGHPIGAVLDSSTSVSLNGRIDLVASYGTVINSAYTTDGLNGPAYYQGSTGLVELGSGSVLRILPEWGSDATVIGNSLALNSLVDIIGRNIHLGNGSVLLAPGAVESLDANSKPLALSESGNSLVNGITLSAGEWFPNGNSPSMLLPTAGQIYLDQGAVIDASGSTDVQVDSAQNFLTLQLRGPELADSPLQRNSAIRGKDITIDIRNTGSYNGTYWVGTPLGKAGGYVGLIQKRVGQLTEAGGSVSLSAGDAVVMSPGSIVNVSGGWTQYSGGSFATTKLLAPDGRAVDISKAVPDQVYTGLLKNAPSSYEAPYLQGASGGSLSIAAPSVALEGGLAGNTVTGFRQLRATTSSGAPPAPSSFRLSLEGVTVNSSLVLPSSPYAPSVLFAKASSPTDLPSFALDELGNAVSLPDAVKGRITLSEGLFSDSGFGKVSILNHDGSISIPHGVKLDAGVGGSVTMEAGNIEVGGNITAPGGSISLMADLVPYALSPLAVNPGDPPILGFPDLTTGNLRLDSGALLSTAGLLTSDLTTSTLAPIMTGGGSIMLAGHDTFLDQGALVDVSGGALVSSSAKLTYGQAGSISIQAGADPQALGGNQPQTVLADIHDGTLQLGSTFRGYSGPGITGGSLSLAATAIRVGGAALAGETAILPSFFNAGGFSSFNLAGIGVGLPGDEAYRPGLVIDQGTVIHPVVASQILNQSRSSLVPFLSPAPLRAAAQLAFSSAGTVDDNLLFGSKVLARGDLVMEPGAVIRVDPQLTATGSGVGGSVTLSGNTVTIAGSISVPGGGIRVAAAGDFPSNDQPPTYPQATLDLAPSAVLSTAGSVLTTIDPLGARSRFGAVLSGGSISLKGNILAEGGLIDVSGASGVLDFLPAQLGLNQGGLVSSRIDSAGGSITLSGKKALYSDATLTGRSGGPTAAGGTVSFSSGSAENPFTLMIVQSGSVLPPTVDPSIPGSKVGVELTLPDVIASPSLNGGGEVSLDTFRRGGFDSVTLGGGSFFSGPISLSVPGTITAATAGTLSADNAVTLSAAHVILGQKFLAPIAPGTSDQTLLGAPTAGAEGADVPGSLTVANARLIDLGNLSLQGIRSTSLSAPGGAIRGDGTLDVTGDLTLTAAEIYPAGSTSFKAVAYGYDPSTGAALSSGGTPGQITVIRSGMPEAPLSAGGSLGLYADTLTIGGSLFAPMGSITLGGSGGSTDFLSSLSLPATTSLTLQAGSLISVSGNGMALPYGSSPDGQKWLDPSGFDITYRGVPGKSISLSASQLTTEKGSSVDVGGGGALEAPQWVYGLGGTINWTGSGTPYASQNSYRAGDLVFYGGSLWSAVQASSGIAPSVGSHWTKLPNSYAIVPGYTADYAPTGYSDGSIPFGQKVRLPGAGGLAAGDYTLLPASYATLPGAYLISASGTGSPGSPVTRPDGSILLSGIVFNGMDGASGLSSLASSFILSSPSVLAAKNEERILQADTFFNSSVASPKPADGGRVQFIASSGMALAGSVSGSGSGKGVGARIDVSSPLSIVVNADGTGDPAGALLLGAEQLSGWSFGSLLLGGSRGAVQSDGTTPVTVTSPSVTIQDGTKLAGNDIILVGGSLISLGSGASVTASGTSSAPDEVLTLGGDGLLLRVSSDSTVTSRRTGVDSLATQLGFTDGNGNPSAPSLSLADGSFLSGKGVILDSSALATISPTATLNAASLSLTAGQIALLSSADLTSVDLDASSANALVLSSAQLNGFSSATSLAFTSYSSLDLYGSGVVGSPSLRSLTLHTGEIRGFDLSGGDALLSARSILLDNPAVMVNPLGSDHPAVQATGPGAATAAADGILRISAETLSLGVNGMTWDQFSAVSLEASSSVTGAASGTFSAGTGSLPSDLKISTPLVTTLGGVSTALSASGALSLVSPSPGESSASAENLQAGGALSLQGSSLSLDSSILLPGGSLTATALSGDLTIGNNDHARISVAGVSGKQGTFLSDVRTSDAGSITLISSTGSVILGAGSSLDLSAAQTSSAGSLSVTASGGAFSVDSQALINAKGGNSGGTGGSFTLDVGSLSSLSIIEPVLAMAGFSSSQSFRIRSGDVAVDAAVKSHSFTVTADGGSIDVTGSINASGKTGGAIALQASGSVILEDGSSLSVHGDTYDAAGKGGSIFLSAGTAINGVINPDAILDLRTGSTLDLGVSALPDRIDQFGGTLHLRAPVKADGTDIQIAGLNSTLDPGMIYAEVAQGDTLSTIASQFGLSVPMIERLNGVTADGLSIGSTLTIPERTHSISDTESLAAIAQSFGVSPDSIDALLPSPVLGTTITIPATTYSVSQADTLDSVAKLFGTSTDALLELNPGLDPSSALIDQTASLAIPDRTHIVGAADSISSIASRFNASEEDVNAVLPLLGDVLNFAAAQYKVGSQDSVVSVASRYGMTTDQLRVQNGLASGSGLRIGSSLKGSVGVSSIAVEGYRLYDLTDGGGDISSVTAQVQGDAQAFFGAPGANSATADQILARLGTALSVPSRTVMNLASGAEIINQGGDLTLSQDWDLSQFRTGANSAPGFLALRASGNIALNASLSDGFSSSDYTATVLSHNTALPANFQSWSYAITAGADLSSANTRAVSKGSPADVTLGLPGLGYDPGNGANALTPQVIRGLYQVIRTGTGDISINASGDFQLRNQFSSVYTAGTLVPDQNLGGTFDTPAASMNGIETTSLGVAQQIKVDAEGNPVFLQDVNGSPLMDAVGNPLPVYQTYPAQFTMAGGNVSIEVGGNIAHKAVLTDGDGNTSVIDDSVRELPSNWLYRRGGLDPITGKFAAVANSAYQLDANGNVLLDTDGVTPLITTTTEITSTAWWVDFSNFFEGVGALGGGNIAMKAGGTISNVDAVIPTQARMAGKTTLSLSDDASLGSVASQSGLALTTLASMNGITVGMIRPSEGATLSIPNGNADSYTVASGDTLQTVADAFGVMPADLAAANNLSLADYVVTQGSMVSVPGSPSPQTLVETGGGDMTIRAGKNLDAGVYYVEKGRGQLRAGGSIITNPSRDTFVPPSLAAVAGAPASTDRAALPTTLFLGKSSFDVAASGNVLLGPAANVFLMPEGLNNGLNYNSYFSTLDASSSVSVSSLGGSVTLRQYAANAGYPVSPILLNWFQGDVSPILPSDNYKSSFYQPWLRLNTGSVNALASQTALQPASLQAVSFGGDILLQGSYTAAPSPSGNIVLDAAGSVIGLSTDGAGSPTIGTSGLYISSTINLSDASPSSMPSPSAPVSSFNGLPFQETGSYSGDAASLQFQQQLHDASLLHKNDPNPMQIVARSGDLTGITLFSPKRTQIASGGFIEDVGLYLQNLSSSDVSVVSAASGIIAYDDQTLYQRVAQAAGTGFSDQQLRQYKARITGSGDIQISGPGTLEVVSGGGIDLGNGPNNADGTGVGITSIGNSRNPALSFDGADIVTMAGVNLPSSLDAASSLNFTGLIQKVQTLPEASNYYQELTKQVLQGGDDDLATALATAGSLSGILSSSISEDQKARLSLVLFSLVLRDAGRNHNKVGSPGYGTYSAGESAIAEIFGSTPRAGDINLRTQSIRTQNGGSIVMVAPGGGVSLASIVPPTLSTLTPPGIVTQHGGAIDVYTRNDVSIGIGRIFTLRGGDIMMWSDKGNIAAGSSAKTVATAPPTRVLIDPTSGNVETDLAGLATGGGIGVLATVKDAAVGNVDLIAPSGVIDAGDAGIRSSGNLNLAATKILNADNIAVAGVSVGAPAPASAASAPPPAPAPASAPAGASAAAAANNSAAADAAKNASSNADSDQAPSIISIDVLGYGGGGDDDDDAKKAASSSSPPVQASL